MLLLKNLSVSTGEKTIIKDFSFTFEQGKIYAIMGPNGSGKSTLAFSIMGHPSYTTHPSSIIKMKKTKLTGVDAHKRAKAGLFLSFQTPLSLNGVTVQQLLHIALSKKNPLRLRKEIEKYATELKISKSLLSRSLNEGSSGGEKKKLEILQAAILNREVMIFDEIDTGVDVDALKTIATFLKKYRKNKTYILITHYNRILHYLKPDAVLIMKDGQLVKVGTHLLAKKIEKEGYEKVVQSSNN